MFKRVKSVFKRDGKEPKEKKPKEPKEKRKGFLRRRGGRVSESEVLPAVRDSQLGIPMSHDGGSAYHPVHPGSYTGSMISGDHALLMPLGAHEHEHGTERSTVYVPPPTIGVPSVHHQHEPVSLHDFPRVSAAPSSGGTHIAYPSSHVTGQRNLSGPSAMSRGRSASRRSVDAHSIAGSDDVPPLPVPPRDRVGTVASRMTRGTRTARDGQFSAVPTTARSRTVRGDFDTGPPLVTRTRSATVRNRSASRSRSRSRERLRAHNSMRSHTTRAAAAPIGGQVREVDYAYKYAPQSTRSLTVYSDDQHGQDPYAQVPHSNAPIDHEGLFRRMRNLYTLEHPDFGFSKCTGKKKAVCIGINYAGTSHALDGCVSDAKRMYRFLTNQYNFPRDQIMVLTDDADARNLPTHSNIMNALHWLARDAAPHDSLFFHYSGHGGQIQDDNGDEVDGLDEMIFPVDYEEAGVIIDDLIHATLISPLPPACRLTAVFDSCHSGSVMDLMYLYHSDGRIMGSDVTPQYRERKMTPAEVICWSGSSDAGNSTDATVNGVAVGAMSYAFVKALKANPRISFADLLRDLRRYTKKYDQRPQLSASHRINVMRTFRM